MSAELTERYAITGKATVVRLVLGVFRLFRAACIARARGLQRSACPPRTLKNPAKRRSDHFVLEKQRTLSNVDKSAPFSSSTFATSVCFFSAAQWRAVLPYCDVMCEAGESGRDCGAKGQRRCSLRGAVSPAAPPCLVLWCCVRALVQQRLDNLQMPLERCQEQRGRAVLREKGEGVGRRDFRGGRGASVTEYS